MRRDKKKVLFVLATVPSPSSANNSTTHLQGISFRYHNQTPLEIDMIVSNEPGYYEDGKFGIRIENLAMVVDAKTEFNFAGTPPPKFLFQPPKFLFQIHPFGGSFRICDCDYMLIGRLLKPSIPCLDYVIS